MWLRSVQYELQHDFAWVTDEAYCSVVLALLQVAFLGKCDTLQDSTDDNSTDKVETIWE